MECSISFFLALSAVTLPLSFKILSSLLKGPEYVSSLPFPLSMEYELPEEPDVDAFKYLCQSPAAPAYFGQSPAAPAFWLPDESEVLRAKRAVPLMTISSEDTFVFSPFFSLSCSFAVSASSSMCRISETSFLTCSMECSISFFLALSAVTLPLSFKILSSLLKGPEYVSSLPFPLSMEYELPEEPDVDAFKYLCQSPAAPA